jgi:4-amino-4-deoxy-L-arabinose transferase-like glycosyltransferase
MWTFFVFAAFATLTKGLIGIVIPGLVVGSWMVLLGEWRILKTSFLPSGLLLFILIAAPWHIWISQANPEFFNFYFVREHFQRYLAKHRSPFHQPWYLIPVLLGGFFPWSAFLVQAIKYNLVCL